jgi:hypothetical protein
MELSISKNNQSLEKPEFVDGNENMKEEEKNNTEPKEITKARSRVTANTPAIFRNLPYHCIHFYSTLSPFKNVFSWLDF